MTCPTSTFSDYYLGRPGAMTKLVLPDEGVTASLSRGASMLIAGFDVMNDDGRVKRTLD